MRSDDPRPVALNLLRIRFPAPAVLSILHRIAGLLLFLGVPLAVYLMELSLSGPAGFARAEALLAAPALRFAGLVILWAFSHHLLAGVRHLLLDLDIGISKAAAHASAWFVNLAAAGVVVAYLGYLGGLW